MGSKNQKSKYDWDKIVKYLDVVEINGQKFARKTISKACRKFNINKSIAHYHLRRLRVFPFSKYIPSFEDFKKSCEAKLNCAGELIASCSDSVGAEKFPVHVSIDKYQELRKYYKILHYKQISKKEEKIILELLEIKIINDLKIAHVTDSFVGKKIGRPKHSIKYFREKNNIKSKFVKSKVQS